MNNNQRKSQIQEKRIVRTLKQIQEKVRQAPASGALPNFKSDIITEDFRVEAKTKATSSSQITLKKEWLTKIEMEALETRKTPLLAFSFGDGVDYYVLRAEDFIEIIEKLKK